MTVELDYKGTKLTSLLNTGTKDNLITRALQESLGIKMDNVKIDICGLGNKRIQTFGRVEMEFSYFNVPTSAWFYVIPSEVIKFQIILGRKFCNAEKLKIDVNRRKIVKQIENAHVDFYLKPNSCVNHKICYNFKVLAAENLTIHNNIKKIKVDIKLPEFLQDQSELWYDNQ